MFTVRSKYRIRIILGNTNTHLGIVRIQLGIQLLSRKLGSVSTSSSTTSETSTPATLPPFTPFTPVKLGLSKPASVKASAKTPKRQTVW